jgi:hypothetical protein
MELWVCVMIPMQYERIQKFSLNMCSYSGSSLHGILFMKSKLVQHVHSLTIPTTAPEKICPSNGL